MKKMLLIIGLFSFAYSARAQFKVQSDGKIAIQTTSTALSPISINGEGNSDYYLSCLSESKNGLYVKALGYNSNTSYGGRFVSSYGTNSIGLYSLADQSSTCCIGMAGAAAMGGKAIGVYGSTTYSNTGAAIYGTTQSFMSIALPQNEVYAGYFVGNVKATGNITAATTIQGTLLGESSNSDNSSALRAASVTGGLSSLYATTYQKERPALPKEVITIDDPERETLKIEETQHTDKMDEQFYEKTHFALDADRLEEVFPDLVYVRDDGSKVINYMEMIPLLVQSINELNAEVKELKSQASGGKARSMRSATSIETTSLAGNVLYQNSPNPFKETTTIRFSLASDAKDAAICIFDMQGKMLQKRSVSVNETNLNLNGYELGAGMYLYTLIVNGQEVDTKRMVLMK